jgi:hypothetical protein
LVGFGGEAAKTNQKLRSGAQPQDFAQALAQPQDFTNPKPGYGILKVRKARISLRGSVHMAPTDTQDQRAFTASLTRCKGTWLAQAPDAAEQALVAQASRQLREHRRIAIEFHTNPEAANAYCIELFRGPEFSPLHFDALLIERMLERVGEPPIVEDDNQAAFSDYLRDAVISVAYPDVRRALASQLRRLLPTFTQTNRWREAIAIDYSAFRTSLGNEVTPYLAQMALAGLADYYDERDDTAV